MTIKLSPEGRKAWRVRWQEGDHWRSRAFATEREAVAFDAEVQRRRALRDEAGKA
jgi:hypothetical protein